MVKVFERYLNDRKASFYEHDLRSTELDFPIPSVLAGGWYVFDASQHDLMVYLRLQCGHVGREALRKAYENASRAVDRGDIDLRFTSCLTSFGINEKNVPCLVSLIEIKEDAEAFGKTADKAILDMARIALGMSPSFTPSSGRKYDLSGLMLLGTCLGFETVYDASKPEVVFKRKEVQSQGTKLDELKALRERVESKIEESKKRLKSLENLEVQTKPAPEWRRTTGISFKDVSGMEQIKEDVGRQVVWPLLNPDKAKRYKLKMPSGMVLHGAPGTGKTHFAKALAGETGCSFREISSSDFGSKYLHESADLIHNLFREAREHAPAILLFDEIDACMGLRGSAEMEKRTDEISAFLAELQECGDKGVFVIGTTNRVAEIDPAITRSGRLDLMFEVTAPDEVQRRQLFADSLKKRPKTRKLDLGRLVELSDGLVAADIVYAVNDAALVAAVQDRKITQDDLEDAVRRRSVKAAAPRKKIGYKTLV